MDGARRLKRLVVLGVTGSIGRQTLEVAEWIGAEVVALASGTGRGLAELAARHPEARLAVADPDAGLDLDGVATGPAAVADLARIPGTVVVNGIVGAAGLEPSVAALEAGNRLALANKETLVAGGPVVKAAAAGAELIPIDSEHSALWQCLVGEDLATVRRLILTASGGPFRGRSPADLAAVTVDEALAHPTWDMGPRITIDSATLMNKAFEVIEAHWLFDIDYDRIDVVVHPESVVHSMVEFVDGAVKAELGDPDMRIPIQYAISYPQRLPAPIPSYRPDGVTLHFEAPDREAFPALELGYAAGRAGGGAPAILNAADEVAVAAFLEGRILFPDIVAVVAATLEELGAPQVATVDDVLAVDAEARRVAAEQVARHAG